MRGLKVFVLLYVAQLEMREILGSSNISFGVTLLLDCKWVLVFEIYVIGLVLMDLYLWLWLSVYVIIIDKWYIWCVVCLTIALVNLGYIWCDIDYVCMQ